ncbi:MAG: C39 family peptidase [Bacillota bacterium]|nr:C39 family peptidase [Bacillota bacterium]
MIISNFNLVKQKRNNTCGYATAGMIISFLEGQKIDEDYLLENEPFDALGITFIKLMDVYRKYLKKYKAEIVYGDIEKMSEVIKNSLQSNTPLHIQYLTNNLMGDGKPVLHYSALIGYDDAEEIYSIADPYGSIKKLKKEEFFEAVSFRNECLPDIIKQKYPSNMMIKFTLG